MPKKPRKPTVRRPKRPAADEDGRTPLWFAAVDNDLKQLRRLLANAAEPNVGDSERRTPLSVAASWGYAEAVELLEFLLSPQAQHLFAELNNEFPIRPDVQLTPGLAELGRFHEEQIPFDALGRRQAEAARVYEEAGWL